MKKNSLDNQKNRQDLFLSYGRRTIMWASQPLDVARGRYVALAMREPLPGAPGGLKPVFEVGFQPESLRFLEGDLHDRALQINWHPISDASKIQGFNHWRNTTRWIQAK